MKSKGVTKESFSRWFDEKGEKDLGQFGLKKGDMFCEFVPDFLNSKTQDLVVVRMKFRQLLGYFFGAFVWEDGRVEQFEKVYGLVEFNHANW